MGVILLILYGIPAGVALLNLLLMPRPGQKDEPVSLAVLIPARNEEENLRRLLPTLTSEGVRVYVYDDDSEDATGDVAASLGARVIRGQGPEPGWVGKSYGCHELALVASEDSDAQWWLFLDADTEMKPGFSKRLAAMAAGPGRRYPVMSGFPEIMPGKGFEPVAFFWVPWLLLSTIPFGLIFRSNLAHPLFTNGQFVLWRARRYLEVMPHQAVKDAVLEDVKIGRLLAAEKIQTAIFDLSSVFRVHMYEDSRAAVKGMTKNSFEVAGNAIGTILVALLLTVWAFAWMAAPVPGLILLVVSSLCTACIVRSRWAWILVPVSLLVGAFSFLKSLAARRAGRAEWKGRRLGP